MAKPPEEFKVEQDMLTQGFTLGKPDVEQQDLIRRLKDAHVLGHILPEPAQYKSCIPQTRAKRTRRVPRSVAHAPIIVILFSGRRREGDLQHWLETLHFVGPKPAVILFDLVYGKS